VALVHSTPISWRRVELGSDFHLFVQRQFLSVVASLSKVMLSVKRPADDEGRDTLVLQC
jgi:hypothetical protein